MKLTDHIVENTQTSNLIDMWADYLIRLLMIWFQDLTFVGYYMVLLIIGF